ncbi:hypothetical protein AAA799E16_01761 [Marine Group I thaumarchaeote SCGC AAA799-E16]|uniref:Uncharacterized protein n=2 Tax=Marine Group I TaxID=905826 RepID=A0A087RXK0_9ARCH|nr:hypothetical protein AAA799E16_01761 [Marine Group I thaumarchaeote SCGC AAA799-E16]KFM18204.1 hypothetical protein SCCGRSA3_01274 [Marine Group I thaumarchaeote SCGC RSA3]
MEETRNIITGTLDDFVTNYIIDSDYNKSKRETYQFYKEIMHSKSEMPLGIGQFGKQFKEYFDEDRSNNAKEWCNIDFKRPIQTKMNYHIIQFHSQMKKKDTK